MATKPPTSLYSSMIYLNSDLQQAQKDLGISFLRLYPPLLPSQPFLNKNCPHF